MDIEVRHLRYFVAVADEGSFTAAARRVHVTQQVLSTQIQQLETILGVQLLERSSRGATVTAAGASFLNGARSTLAELDRAASAARNSAHAIRGVLPVGLSVAAGGELPTRILAAFQREEPAVEIRLHSFELTHPAGGLLDHSTDVAFTRPPLRAAGLKLATLAEEPRVFVLPAGHPLAARDCLRLSDTEALPWIAAAAATDGCHPTAWRDDWLLCPRPGGAPPVIGATARTIDEWREYVVAGRGVSLCPASAETFHARPGLTFVPSSGVPITPLCLAWRSDETSPAVRRFITVAREMAGAVGED
jgi:DNA-binding transcriptional LysR family regulator